jgi:hypothetical protein
MNLFSSIGYTKLLIRHIIKKKGRNKGPYIMEAIENGNETGKEETAGITGKDRPKGIRG